MVWIGIDPGKKGGYALIYEELGKVEAYPWDDGEFTKKMFELYDSGCECKCCLEKVGAMPKQGLASTFNFGTSFGFIQGVLTAYHIPYQLVPPQTWKKAFSLTSDKQTSIQVCHRLFPDLNLLPTARCRKDSDGMGESALMAEFARRKL